MNKSDRKPRKSGARDSFSRVVAYPVDDVSDEQLDNMDKLIRPRTAKRQWMDETPDRYAYRCIPMTMANTMGWELLSQVNCEITWNGVCP